MARARAEYHDNADLWITFPYDPMFISNLKDRVPVGCREWRPERRAWWVHALYAPRVIDMMRAWWPDVEVIRPGQRTSTEGARRYWTPPPPPPPRRDDPYQVLHLLPSAPVELVEAAGRTLAKLCHPDTKPEGERALATVQMQAINAAVDRVRRLRQGVA